MIGTPLLRTVSALAVAGVLVAAGPSAAQEPQGPWSAWLGCWVPVGMMSEGASLCFLPTGDPEVAEFVTVVDDRIESRETVRSDGAAHATRREGCEGTESLRLSDDGLRFLTRSSHTCENGIERSATGVMAMISPTQWLDVRAVSRDDEPATSVQFYQLAALEVDQIAGTSMDEGTARAVRAARLAAAAPPDPVAVEDASQWVDGAAVEGWLVESGYGFDLDGSTLLELADAGVEDRVIDVMIALSFPNRFDIDRRGQPLDRTVATEGWGGSGHGPAAIPLSWGYPVVRSGFWFGYDAYGPWGYGGPGYWYRGYRPIYVDVSPAPSRTAKVVKGRGYTQGRGSSSGGTVSSSRSAGGDRHGGGDWRRGGDSGSGTSSTTTTGRKAKRRGGG